MVESGPELEHRQQIDQVEAINFSLGLARAMK